MGSDNSIADQVVGPKVFVSYRRSDTEDVAGQLSSLLKKDLGSRNVYRDRESMILGQPWREALSAAMRDADAALFLVGPGWEGESETGRRIDNPDDVVRCEAAEALSAQVRANPLPLLVDRSAPPEDLPHDVRDLFDQPHFVSMDREEVTSGSSAGYQSILVGVWAALARLVPRGVIILGESTKMVELDSLVEELAEAGVVESQSLSRFASGVYIASWRDVKKLKSDFPDLIVQSSGDPSEELKARLAAYATLSVGATVAVTGVGAAALVALGPSLGFGGSGGGAAIVQAASGQLAAAGATTSGASAGGISGMWATAGVGTKVAAAAAGVAIAAGGVVAASNLLDDDTPANDAADTQANNTAGTPIPVGNDLTRYVAITPDGTTAYVTNTDGTVTPIDVATNTAGAPIPVGTSLEGVAITPDGTTAYVTNGVDGTVVPIDVATNTAGIPIRVGNGPLGVAITPDGTTAYSANGDGTVTPIDVATNTAGTPIPVGNVTDPLDVAITPDGTTAYVTNRSGTVVPIDVATNTAGTPIPIGANPGGVAITPDGTTAYVADRGDAGNSHDGTVVPIDVATNTARTPIPVGDPGGVAVTPDGTTAYVTDVVGDTVVPVDVATNTAGTPIPVGDGPWRVAITPDGTTAYVTNTWDGTVTPIDVATS